MHKYKISTENISYVQDFAEVILYVAVRGILAIFVSLVAATTLYLVSLPIVLSIWARTSIDFDIIGTIFASVGATLAGFFIWMNRGRTAKKHFIFLGLTVICSITGAWIGSFVGSDPYPYDILGLPGIPILVGIILGAALGANAPHFVVEVSKALRNPRL